MSAAEFKKALESANVVSIAPDMSLIDNGRRPAVWMPSTLFGPAWPIIEQVAEETSTAPDYAGIALLAVAASLVGGKRLASPYGGAWEAPAILWMAAVGDPSSRKSAPLALITKPLEQLQRTANEDYALAKRIWESDAERAKAERDKWKSEVKGAAGTGVATAHMPEAAIEPPAQC